MSKGQHDKSVAGSPTVAEVEDATEFIRREKAKYAKVPDETMPQPSGIQGLQPVSHQPTEAVYTGPTSIPSGVEKDVLLPCPFCGERERLSDNGRTVYCHGCGGQGPEAGDEHGQANELWNRRATKERTP